MRAATLDFEQAGARTWDVIVIGAGPAGALAARQIAAGRARVLLVDRKAFPRPKVCGACLNGKALAVLESVGLEALVDRLGGIDLGLFTLRLDGREARFALPCGKALGRDRLDAALVDAAVAAGADFLPAAAASVDAGGGSCRTVRLVRPGHEVAVEARVVVVAAGLAGLSLRHDPTIRTRIAAGGRVGAGCTVAHEASDFGPGTIHMAVGRSGYVGLVRVPGALLNVAAALDRGFVREAGGPARAAAALLDEAGFPPVPALADASWQGTPTLTRRTRPVAGHRLLLIGDAAGYVEPFTGEGMGVALTSALGAAPLALRGVSHWDNALETTWRRRYHHQVGRYQGLCRGLAVAARHPLVATILFRLVARAPAVAGVVIRRLNDPAPLLEAT